MAAFDRRSILLGGAGLAGAVAVACTDDKDKGKGTGDKDKGKPGDDDKGEERAGLSEADVLPVLVAVADRLLPADEHGPGAVAAGVETFLKSQLEDPRLKGAKSVLMRGAVWLSRAARKETGKAFTELSTAEIDEYLHRFAENQVRPSGFTPSSFVKVMLALTLESFLGDPRYGGNKDQIGWKFVGGVDWSGRK